MAFTDEHTSALLKTKCRKEQSTKPQPCLSDTQINNIKIGVKNSCALLTSWSTILFAAKSALLPANAITMFGLACLCSSFTQVLALPNVSCEIAKHII